MSDSSILLSLVLAVAILTTCIVIARLADQRYRNKELQGLVSTGRSISAAQAIDEYEHGLGLLVQNNSLLPGSWWYLRNSDRPENCDLVTAMRNFGYVFVFNSARERKAIETYKGTVGVLLEPFDE